MGPREPLDCSPGGSEDKVSIRSSHSLHASFRRLASMITRRHGQCSKAGARGQAQPYAMPLRWLLVLTIVGHDADSDADAGVRASA
jgi:hypothetical protein